MWPLERAKSDSVWFSWPTSSDGSRTAQGSIGNCGAPPLVSTDSADSRIWSVIGLPRTVEELGQVTDHSGRPVSQQIVGVPRTVHPDDVAEPAGAPRLHSGDRVLEDARLLRSHAQLGDGGQKGVGLRLAAQAPLDRHDPV